jgi:hypothetical protein
MHRLIRIMVSVAATSTAVSCDYQESGATSQEVSYAYREPGSNVMPTHDASLALIAAEGPARFATLQATLAQAGKKCLTVTRAVLLGGLDGTDEWKVTCSDSGDWEMWFQPGTIEITHCSAASCT